MSEAEKKWELHFEKSNYRDINYNREMSAVRDYKAAMIREIEKLIDFETEGSEWDAAIDTVLKLLDTVEP